MFIRPDQSISKMFGLDQTFYSSGLSSRSRAIGMSNNPDQRISSFTWKNIFILADQSIFDKSTWLKDMP